MDEIRAFVCIHNEEYRCGPVIETVDIHGGVLWTHTTGKVWCGAPGWAEATPSQTEVDL